MVASPLGHMQFSGKEYRVVVYPTESRTQKEAAMCEGFTADLLVVASTSMGCLKEDMETVAMTV